jgi:hypothetical protein
MENEIKNEIKIEAKYCGKCKSIKSVKDFYKCQGRNHWNLSSNCKTCMNENVQRYRDRKKVSKEKEKEIISPK